MKLYLLILIPFFLSFDTNAQFQLNKDIQYTDFNSVDSLLKYWDSNPKEVDNFVGIYEFLSTSEPARSTTSYILGVIKSDDIYKIIMLGGKYGYMDVEKGGIKAIAQKMPAEGVYNLRWRMANAKYIENGYIIKEGSIITVQFSKYAGNETKFIMTYSPFNKKNNTLNNQWKGNGTGFFISKDGYIATNYHVIAESTEIELEFIRNGQKQNYKAKIIQSDKQNDLAILKIDDNSFSPFSLIPFNFETSLTNVGTNVFALGYPMALSLMGTEIKFTDGKISSKTGFQGDISTYQMTTPIQPGNSGGPLFDFDGNLVGVNSAKIRADVADNVSYAIKSSYLKNLIDVLPTAINLPNDKSIINKTLPEKIKIISDYVVLIRVK
jgi:S1-C subfamily serine protease